MFFDMIPKTTKKDFVVRINDFSAGLDKATTENLVPLKQSVDTFNFDYTKKGLSDGLGLKPLVIYNGDSTKTMTTPSGIGSALGFWTYHKVAGASHVPMMMLYGGNGHMYYGLVTTLNGDFSDYGVSFSRTPVCLNYRLNGENVFFACSTDKVVVFTNTNCSTYTQNVPSITSAVFNSDLLFATLEGNENKIFYSSTLNPASWNMSNFDGEYIELNDDRGACQKLIDAGEYVYVVRDFGLTRISDFDREQIKIEHVYSSHCKIYPESVVLCGNSIVFLCRDGVYSFNGSSAKKLDLGIESYLDKVENKGAIGAYLFGKYYLACKLKITDGLTVGCESSTYTNNALIEYDMQSGKTQTLRGVDVSAMCEFYSDWSTKLVVCLKNSVICELTWDGSVNSAPTTKVWTSGYTDFGYAELHKVIKRIYLNTKTDLNIKILADGMEYSYQVSGNDLPQAITTNIRARKFSFSILCENAGCEISNLEFSMALC